MASATVKKCYTYVNTKSHKSVNTKTQETCIENTNYCAKFITPFRSSDGSQDEMYARQCGTPFICQRDGCYTYDKGSICCCSKNLCNSSTITTGISSFVVLLSYFLFRS